MRWILLAVAVSTVLVGCGGGGGGDRSSKSEDGVRAVSREFFSDFKDGKFGDACDLMTPAAKKEIGQSFGKGNGSNTCAGVLAFGRGFIGTRELDKLAATFETTPITITGDAATAAALTPDDSASHYRYINGRWYVDADRSGSSSSATSTAENPSGATAERWATNWCRVKPGMTPAQARKIMGPPTDQGQEDMSWSAFQWQFNAFLSSDGTLRQLDVNDSELSSTDRAKVKCASTRRVAVHKRTPKASPATPSREPEPPTHTSPTNTNTQTSPTRTGTREDTNTNTDTTPNGGTPPG